MSSSTFTQPPSEALSVDVTDGHVRGTPQPPVWTTHPNVAAAGMCDLLDPEGNEFCLVPRPGSE